jgi:hypothetical protein
LTCKKIVVGIEEREITWAMTLVPAAAAEVADVPDVAPAAWRQTSMRSTEVAEGSAVGAEAEAAVAGIRDPHGLSSNASGRHTEASDPLGHFLQLLLTLGLFGLLSLSLSLLSLAANPSAMCKGPNHVGRVIKHKRPARVWLAVGAVRLALAQLLQDSRRYEFLSHLRRGAASACGRKQYQCFALPGGRCHLCVCVSDTYTHTHTHTHTHTRPLGIAPPRDALMGITARPGCTNQPPQPLSAPGPQCGSWPSRHSFRPRDGCPNNVGTTRNSERLDACWLNRKPLLEHGLLRFPQGICTRWPHRKSAVHCQIQ